MPRWSSARDSHRALRVLLAAALVAGALTASAAPAAAATHTITFDRYSLSVDGKRTFSGRASSTRSGCRARTCGVTSCRR